MKRTLAVAVTLTCFTAASVQADFSYEQSSKITGGMMAGAMKLAGAFSKKAREPIASTVMVKGNRMVQLQTDSAQIIDLDRETITDVNFQKKTYSTITFAQMKEAMEQMAAKMKAKQDKQNAEMDFKMSVKETGQSKQINGLDAKEMVMTIVMEGTDKESGNKGGMTVESNMWMAAKIAGYQEVQNFYKRMAEKMAWVPGTAFGSMAGGQPGAMQGMAELAKEASKLEGVPVLQITKVGVQGEGQAQASGAGSAPPAAQQQQAEAPSAKESAAGAIAGRLGRFGGFGRKKKPEPQEKPAPAPEPAAAQSGGTQTASSSLMEITTELRSFSGAPVDGSKFEVPGGFKQVESETLKSMKR